MNRLIFALFSVCGLYNLAMAEMIYLTAEGVVGKELSVIIDNGEKSMPTQSQGMPQNQFNSFARYSFLFDTDRPGLISRDVYEWAGRDIGLELTPYLEVIGFHADFQGDFVLRDEDREDRPVIDPTAPVPPPLTYFSYGTNTVADETSGEGRGYLKGGSSRHYVEIYNDDLEISRWQIGTTVRSNEYLQGTGRIAGLLTITDIGIYDPVPHTQVPEGSALGMLLTSFLALGMLPVIRRAG